MGPRSVILGGGNTCARSHWGLRLGFLWGHGTCGMCPKVEGGRHANAATGAFSGASYGATNRVRGVSKIDRKRHVNTAAGSLGGAPYGATTRVR
eukprot:1764587-Pyramimonas_sp.AAC.1